VGGALLLVYGIIVIAVLVLQILVIIDILKHSDAAWQVSGQNKTTWIVLWVVGWCCGFAVVIDLIYWFAIRPKLQAAAAGGGGYPGGPGGYPPAGPGGGYPGGPGPGGPGYGA
jgi:hypothetical protein